jgi:clan AA aspartic protease
MMIKPTAPKQGKPVGLVYADISLTHFYSRQTGNVRTMVDTGTTHMIVPPHIARELGFDLEEVSTYSLTIADSRRVRCPKVHPIEIRLGDRTYVTEAAVLGDECLMGVLPLEAMDLVVDPKNECVIANPAHPDGPTFRV